MKGLIYLPTLTATNKDIREYENKLYVKIYVIFIYIKNARNCRK